MCLAGHSVQHSDLLTLITGILQTNITSRLKTQEFDDAHLFFMQTLSSLDFTQTEELNVQNSLICFKAHRLMSSMLRAL